MKILSPAKEARLLLAVFLFFIYSISAAQLAEKAVVFVPCKAGELVLDGISLGSLDAEDARREMLAYGEHYIQLKARSGNFGLTLVVDSSTSTIVRIGCSDSPGRPSAVLINKQVSLSGLLSSDTESNLVGLDKNDEITLNCAILNKKGKAILCIRDYNTGAEIYKKEGFNKIEDDKIKVPAKGVYQVQLYTEALFGKNASLRVERKPAPESSPGFSTLVKAKLDTSAVEVLNTVTRVYSTTNLDHTNKTTIAINLPAGTSYWVYWIGAGQQAINGFKAFSSSLSASAGLLSANPLVRFGFNLIPSLPSFSAPTTINYRFLSSAEAGNFLSNRAYSYYAFKHADHISADYARVNFYIRDLVLALNNESLVNGQNVEVRVVAFIINRRMVLEE